MTQTKELTKADFVSEGDVKWCPGCGDYAILSSVQTVLPTLGIPKEKFCFVSGIGCSSRFPYYMDTYGFHTIHGRAPTVASGVKMANPDLSVWVITGDGDGLSIGANHTVHMIRRNMDLKVLLFNNRIYGLTKGQYSPTSEKGKVTKTSLYGSIDNPLNPVAFAIASGATFAARTNAANPKHMQEILKAAADHKGTAFVEILQNCNIFNDGAFEVFTEKASKPLHALFVEQGKPLTFGANNEMGIRFDGLRPEVVTLGDKYSADDLWIHDEKDFYKAQVLVRLFDSPTKPDGHFPRPFGVFFETDRACYEDVMAMQIEEVIATKGKGDLDKLLRGREVWEIL